MIERYLGGENLNDRCERANFVNMSCSSGCGFRFGAGGIGVYTRKDLGHEICVDNQAEFILEARAHTQQYAGIDSISNPETHEFDLLVSAAHNVFEVKATINGLVVPCLPIVVK